MGRGERNTVARGARLYEAAQALCGDHDRVVEAVQAAWKPLQDEAVARELDATPVARLEEVTEGRLQWGGMERNGLRTVGQVLEAGPYRLRQIPGIGRRTADQIFAAAQRLSEAAHENVAVRIDVDLPEPRTAALVIALNPLVEAGPNGRRAVGTAQGLVRRLGPLLADAGPATGRLRMLLAGQERRSRALAAVDGIRSLVEDADRVGVLELLAQASVDLLREPATDNAAWVDFELRSAEYYSLLAEMPGQVPDVGATQGFLPDKLAERVRRQRLDDSRLSVSLRGYQEFGARFVLAQRKVVLGDEMGLGKTIQAIAALTHLVTKGQSHFMVVCPPSLLVNWVREMEARSTLRPVLLYGPDRHEGFDDWKRQGGVGVTTFDALRGFPAPGNDEVGMLVVDEAHLVKNPKALRSQAVAQWVERSERALFMTGTPMENRVGEFRNLIRMLRPGLADSLTQGDALTDSVAFRKAVATVYLRRNQKDVLAELPVLQHTDEWEELSVSDEEVYREAVRAGNFMAMRRAAYMRPEKSAKLERLREIVREAGENGQKTVVFSYFKDVLGVVGEALATGSPVHGPLTGGVPAARRQQVVDDFVAVSGPAVLLAQVQAAGIGLNIQAASVVVICEPQTKPTIEQQAVARVHRMGQLRRVRVHRLLATGGVDESMVRMLERKTRLFDSYARRSVVAEATPDAVDVSDVGIARRIVEEEQVRLGMTDEGPTAAE
ncbi:DEAD/DEAH box helicase [Streptomyces sp. NPDC058872]|uniref:DEAD/DEAH box helicase n=1 Tax=Streptomyces sp. NPDC058872 TaxID=3346661 RepID=UPI0036B67B35